MRKIIGPQCPMIQNVLNVFPKMRKFYWGLKIIQSPDKIVESKLGLVSIILHNMDPQIVIGRIVVLFKSVLIKGY